MPEKEFIDKASNLEPPTLIRLWLARGKLTIFASLVAILLGGCTSGSKPGDPDNPTLTARQTQQWSQSCALCHISGVGGAPVVGNAEQWLPRLEQGQAQLLTHTLEGYANMPPLGYCMSCEVEDFRAMIAWMSRTNP